MSEKKINLINFLFFKIFLVKTPKDLALDEADLVDWALKTEVSISDSDKTSL